MKKILLCLCLTFFITILNIGNAFAVGNKPTVNANGVVIMDAKTGAVIYSKNQDTKYPPASTTKIMTVLLTLEKCKLDEIVKVGALPPTVDGSKIYIDKDEELTVEQLLYAVIMASANDCATALAEHISGSVDNFVKLMNDRAKELGCTNTTFKNPHGLYDPEHRTTAHDLALIEKELLKHDEYIKISKTKATFIPPTNKYPEQRPLWNGNRLIHEYEQYYYEYALAGKTGYTEESKHSYVASAQKNEDTFVVSMLYDTVKTYFSDSKNLFEWAFNNFKTVKLYSKGQEITTFTTENGTVIPLLADDDVFYTRDINSTEEPKFHFDSNQLKNKFFLKDEKIAEGTVTYQDQSYKISLISGIEYEKKSLPIVGELVTTKNNTINYKYLTLLAIFIILFLILLFLVFLRRRKNRKIAKNKKYFVKKRY